MSWPSSISLNIGRPAFRRPNRRTKPWIFVYTFGHSHLQTCRDEHWHIARAVGPVHDKEAAAARYCVGETHWSTMSDSRRSQQLTASSPDARFFWKQEDRDDLQYATGGHGK